MRGGLWAVLLPLVLSPGGCYLEEPRGGPNLDVSGSWSGQVEEFTAGSGAMTMTVNQSFAALSAAGHDGLTLAPDGIFGDWAFSFSDSAHDRQGDLTGTVTGSSVYAQLNVVQLATVVCTAEVGGTATGNSLTGTFESFDCTSLTGTFSLTRQ